MKFSIIIPVYNVAPYLRECLDSLLAQDMPADEYEIIAVDDGSTDASPAILREYAAAHPGQVIVIGQANAGPGVARNTGFAASRGEYVWFVDGDDVAARGVLPEFAAAFAATGADVLCFGHEEFSGKLPACRDGCAPPAGIFPTTPVTTANILCTCNNAPWDKVFSRELLTRANFAFPPLRGPEDMAEIYRLVAHARRVVQTGEVCYFYRKRPGSLMRNWNASRMADQINALELLRSQIRLFPELRCEYEYVFWKRVRYALDNAGKAKNPHVSTFEAMLDGIPAGQNIYISLAQSIHDKHKRQLTAIENSLSWRVTAPLRCLFDILAKFRN